MVSTRIRLAGVINGSFEATGAGVAILVDRSVDEMAAVLGSSRDHTDLPRKWLRNGHLRASEAKAACDSQNPADVIGYLALRAWGTRVALTMDPDNGDLWLLTDDPEVARFVADEANE